MGASTALTGKLRLPERFQLVRISPREYKLVSIYESLSLKAPEGADGLLDRILPALEEGCELKHLLAGARKPESRAIRRIVQDFADRGLVEKAAAKPRSAGLGEPRRYARQKQFFANFHALEGTAITFNLQSSSGSALQEKLAKSVVMLVGLGRAGSRVARALASVGVGKIVGSDPEVITENDLADSAFVPADAGQGREQVLRRQVAEWNPSVEFSPLGRPLFASAQITLPDGIDMLVLCEDQFHPQHYQAINQACLEKKIPWTSYRAYGTRLEIGPLVVPHETACFQCYELRRMSNSPSFAGELEIQKRLSESNGSLGNLNITHGTDILALEVVKMLTHFASPATYANVFVMDTVSLQSRLHPVLRIPRCPACGKSQARPSTNMWRFEEEDLDGR